MTELSREAILAMVPGRELDKVVGRELFDAKIITKESKITEGRILYLLVSTTDETFKPMEQGKDMRNAWWRLSEDEAWEAVPRYSTDISAAWEVVEVLNGKYGFLVQREGDYFDEGQEWEGWEASFGGNSDRLVKAKTAPLAICRAALLTTLEESK